MNRAVEPELLDELPPADPRAAASRRDLRWLNAWMGNARTAARALRRAFAGQPPRGLADLGAGDGTFLLSMARRLPRAWQPMQALLLDRQPSLSPQTHQGFKRLGWQVQLVESEVLEWLRAPASPLCEAVVANLFLHHFAGPQLTELLARAAARCRVFVAVEPRRSAWGTVLCHWLWLLGCNAVTRHDAPVSVRAGFAGRELSGLWPEAGSWSLREGPAGLASHAFIAVQQSL